MKPTEQAEAIVAKLKANTDLVFKTGECKCGKTVWGFRSHKTEPATINSGCMSCSPPMTSGPCGLRQIEIYCNTYPDEAEALLSLPTQEIAQVDYREDGQ